MRDPELEMEVDELCHLVTDREPNEKEMYVNISEKYMYVRANLLILLKLFQV